MDGRLLWHEKSHEQQQQTKNYEWRPLFFWPLEQKTRAISRNTTDSVKVAPEEWGHLSQWVEVPSAEEVEEGEGVGNLIMVQR